MKKKRKHSIVWKITMWYTIFFGILTILIGFAAFMISERILERNVKSELIYQVEEVLDEVEYDDNVLELDEDIDFLHNRIFLSVYDKEGELVAGYLPKGYKPDKKFDIGFIQPVSILGESWYQYEQSIFLQDYGTVVVQGFVLADAWGVTQNETIQVVACLFPILLLIATIGGYILTKRALKPAYQMIHTAEQINSGKDLSKRLNLSQGDDELYQLANTFDSMFARLEDAFERETQFTSDVSHELRTPVSVIISQCEYAMELEKDSEVNEALQSILGQSRQMSKIINQLLFLARTEKMDRGLSLETIDVSTLLSVVVEQAKEKASNKNIQIRTQIEKHLQMQGDETMMIRFFLNLIQNAITYSKEEGIVEVCLYRENDWIKGYVKDYGTGIGKEHLDKIWNRFYQVSPSRTSVQEGSSGLGLSMVKCIANVHHGTVNVESELGRGSVFSFSFPVGI